MRMLRQLSETLESIPVWGQILICLFLVGYSFVSIYGRINTKFGAKAFSRIPEDRIRKDKGHIFQYTIIPAVVTIGFLIMVFLHHIE